MNKTCFDGVFEINSLTLRSTQFLLTLLKIHSQIIYLFIYFYCRHDRRCFLKSHQGSNALREAGRL